MDNFTQKINELTPNLNFNRKNFFKFTKRLNPLQKTKDLQVQRDKFSEKELKEFSVLYLITNNFNLFSKHIELISEINFSSNLVNELKQKLIDKMLSENIIDKKIISLDSFDKKFTEVLKSINSNAPVKIIVKNKSESEILAIFSEIVSELKKLHLRSKIESLEDKVSLNLDEKLYSELLSLRNQLKSG